MLENNDGRGAGEFEDLDYGNNGPFCHYCMGQGLGKEGLVHTGRNNVLCLTHLNDPSILGWYLMSELKGADLSDQLTLENQKLMEKGGFFERAIAQFEAQAPRHNGD